MQVTDVGVLIAVFLFPCAGPFPLVGQLVGVGGHSLPAGGAGGCLLTCDTDDDDDD